MQGRPARAAAFASSVMQPEQVKENGPEAALVGTVLAGRYRVDRLLGSGGMGSVYLAEHQLMRKAVALKVLHREMTVHDEVVARFEREAVAAARIDHPNVAAAMDCGRLEDGSFFLVLEYVDGKSLRTVLEQGPLDVDRALGIASQMANALAAAHAAGIVHRDLKPDNVMLVEQPERGESVKVLDFGIAKVQGSDDHTESQRALTRIGTVMGTAGYMSPEQALGQSVDARADLYALGVVLYEMLSGRLPFAAEEPTQILAKQLTEPVPPLPPGVPAELSSLVGNLLEKAVEARTGSITEVSEALARIRQARSSAVAPTAFLSESQAVAARTGIGSADVPGVEPGPARATPPRRFVFGAIAAGILALLLVLWKARSSGEAEAAQPSAGASASAAEVLPPVPSAPTPSAVAEGSPATKVTPPAPAAAPTASSSTETTTETKTTRVGGRTVTSTRTTRKTTTTERRTEKKRKTGPGGIYIPPPSEWFK